MNATGTTPTLTINSERDIVRAIALHHQIGAIGMAHLLRARLQRRIAFWTILPTTTTAQFKHFAHTSRGRPTVLLIGDDDGFDRGPAGWTQAARAVRWAASVLLHGAGAAIAHYQAAIEAAEVMRRVLVVECSAATLPAWCEPVAAAPHRPAALVIAPHDGVHPVPLARSSLQ